MPFGQVVVGPPGSGKSTYCAALAQYLASIGRTVAVVNLDPANNGMAYSAAVDVTQLVDLVSVMEQTGLGPNGGLIWAVEYLEANLDWLLERLKPLTDAGHYLVLDCPGQVELFQLHTGFKDVLQRLERELSLRLVAVQLVDAHLCADAGKYLAGLLLSLSTMLHLELPQVNVLSKFDLIHQLDGMAFSEEFYLEATGLSHLADTMQGTFPPRYHELAAELCEVVEDFGLLNFVPLAVDDSKSLERLVALTDKANGYYAMPTDTVPS